MNKESGSDASIAGPSRRISLAVGTNSSSDKSFTVPAARSIRRQKRAFCPAWLENPVFKPWLQQLPSNPYKGKCSICNVTINTMKSNLVRHGNTQEHTKNMKYRRSSVERGTNESTSTDEATNMDVEIESSGESTFAVLGTKKVWSQTFLAHWLEEPAFKPWLKQVQGNPYQGKCSVCNVNIRAKKSNLLSHASSQEHLKNMKYGKSSVERSTNESTSMDVGTEASSDSTIAVSPLPLREKERTFLPDWLEDPVFKPWLQQVEDDPTKGKCTFCYITIKAKKCNLQQHGESQKHIDNVKYGRRVLPGEGTRTFTDEVKEAEIRVCTAAIEHNRPFHSFDHFDAMAQEAFKNPNVLKCMSLTAKKMKAISINVINKSIVSKTVENVQGKFFSVVIDKTTDTANTKIHCFVMRYVHEGEICTELLDLIRIKEATAEKLHQCLRNSLRKYNLPISDMVGFGLCVDNAYAMLGAHSSLASRLLADNGEICILPCICHSIDLAARHACECLPRHVEKFLNSLYSYFALNPTRLSMLEGTQQFMTAAKRKVLEPSATRWLEISECIKRVLNQWTVLFRLFAVSSAEKESKVANRIYLSLNCLFTKAYLQFMDYLLQIFIELNEVFQSSKVLLHRLLPECYRLLKSLGSNFVKSKNLKQPNIHKFDIDDEDNLLPLTAIFTGAGCMNTLSQIANGNSDAKEEMLQFYRNAQRCYKLAFQNIVDRVPFDDEFLNALDFLNPKTAIDIEKHQDVQLKCILNKFQSKFDHDVVVNEWHKLPFTFSEEVKVKLEIMSLPQFWHEMSTTTNADDECILSNITKLAQLCLSLPHSNADVERYFAIVTQVKSKGRGRLNSQTIAALTRIKLDMKSKNAHCYDYNVTDDMLKLFNDDMYNTEEELIGSVLADESTTDSENH